jgi:hydrogenase maturation protease
MTSVLIACIGNIRKGDDAFGVEIARRLCAAPLPNGVKVVDFGVSGIDLAYALLDGYEAVVLVDAAERDEAPGTLSIVELAEPEDQHLAPPWLEDVILPPQELDSTKVIRLASALGGTARRVLLVACEPLTSKGGAPTTLSAPVSAALEPAVQAIQELASALVSRQPARPNDWRHPRAQPAQYGAIS